MIELRKLKSSAFHLIVHQNIVEAFPSWLWYDQSTNRSNILSTCWSAHCTVSCSTTWLKMSMCPLSVDNMDYKVL